MGNTCSADAGSAASSDVDYAPQKTPRGAGKSFTNIAEARKAVEKAACAGVAPAMLRRKAPGAATPRADAEAVAAQLQRALLASSKFSLSESAELRQFVVDSGCLGLLSLQLGLACSVRERDASYVLPTASPAVKAAHRTARETLQADDEARAKAVKDAEASATVPKSGTAWAAGVGYGSGAATGEAVTLRSTRSADDAAVDGYCAVLLDVIAVIAACASSDGHDPAFASTVAEVLIASPLIPVLRALAHGGEDDIVDRADIYSAAYNVIEALATHDNLAAVLVTRDDDAVPESTVAAGLAEQAAIAAAVTDLADGDEPPAVSAIMGKISRVCAAVSKRQDEAPLLARGGAGGSDDSDGEMAVGSPAKGGAAASAAVVDIDAASEIIPGEARAAYVAAIKKVQFAAVKDLVDRHKFGSAAKGEGTGSGAARTKRVMRELRSLRATLPREFESSIFLRYDKARPYVMQAAIAGPHDTPYDSGLFVFDIYCPPSYPATPPQCNIVTTGGGSTRFSPNLYSNGKVCLSLLGTWSGAPSEGWTESSTLLQLLLSIQSLILVELPYYCEPGLERSPNETQARVSGNGGWEPLRVETMRLAIADNAKAPPAGFEEAFRAHFRLKASHIRHTLRVWRKHADSTPTSGYKARFAAEQDKVESSLSALEGPPDAPADLARASSVSSAA